MIVGQTKQSKEIHAHDSCCMTLLDLNLPMTFLRTSLLASPLLRSAGTSGMLERLATSGRKKDGLSCLGCSE